MTSQNSSVQVVPASLLQDRRLSASAKLIWMLSRLNPPDGRAGPGWLTEKSGLSRPTVYGALTDLAAAGWGEPVAHPAGPTPEQPESPPNPPSQVALPIDLLTDRRLSPAARLLYGLLLLLPSLRYQAGSFTYAELAAHAQFSRNTLEKALTELAAAEWIATERANRKARIQFTITFPGYTRGLNGIAAAQRRRRQSEHGGEWLMREFLNLLSDRTDYQDEASPGFLVNPQTGELLRFDRFYPPDLAFEFHGPQHFRPTKKFSAEQVSALRLRDYIKMGICMEQGIRVVVVLADDLTLDGMRRKAAGLLPFRDLAGQELLIEYLEQEAQDVRWKMAQI